MATDVISISLPPGTLKKLDAARGDVKRSNYIGKVLTEHLEGLKDGKKK